VSKIVKSNIITSWYLSEKSEGYTFLDVKSEVFYI
jgi:hypothetical protein